MKNILTQILSIFFLQTLNAQSFVFNQATGSPISNTSNERGLISRDVNADGKKDLLVANLYSQTVRVLLGNGSGQFTDAPGSPISVVTGPNYLAIADFNGDNNLDLATANYNSNNVTILLGTGTGSFTISSTISTGLYPYCIDVADFNLDGKMDLVTCNVNSNDIHILIGNGSGGFSVLGSPISAGGMPYHVVTGNINADAFPDFIAANGQGNNIGVYFGNGSGGFNTPVMYSTGTQPRTITLKDLNSDGYADMSIANALSDNITVLMGSATGTFSNASGSPFTAVGSYPYQCAVADFNLDGKVDIATGNCFSNALYVFSGNGNGTFNTASAYTVALGSGPQPIIAEDFNGDAKPDLAIGYWYDTYLNVYLNTSSVSCNVQSSFTYTTGVNGLITFNNNSTGTVSASTYTWNYGDANTSTAFQSNHTYISNGTYTVTLIANNNTTPSCTDTTTQIITINSINACNLISAFTFTAASNGLVNFSNTSTGTISGTSYLWNYGDLINSGAFQSPHTYLNSGTYIITLTANNNSTPTCVHSSTQAITIEVIKVGLSEQKSTKIPVIFPNPSNGILYIENPEPSAKIDFIIYNFLGQEMLRATLHNQTNTFKLDSFQAGVYSCKFVEGGTLLKTTLLILNK